MTQRAAAGPEAGEARRERLDYIHQMLVELRVLAVDTEAPMLAYLLEMSLIEAAEVVKLHELRHELMGGR
ncbi:MAG: hypothetical protein BroJett030_29760 [Alphaproteobacteria bacterium]|nr:MAG: hypothetical protein BroJett030_29760 [Alphaproteobacteria bacterium]